MNRRQFCSFALAAGALSACGGGPAPQDAAERFLTERNGGTPVALNAGGLPPDAPLLGAIASIDGHTLTIKPPTGDAPTTVELAADATLRRQTVVPLAEIKLGEAISAIGALTGDSMDAQVVRLGDDSGPPAPVILQSGGTGAGPAGGDRMITNGALGQMIRGSVERVAGPTIVVRRDGAASAEVKTSAATAITRLVDIAPGDLQPGMMVSVTGTRTGAMFAATGLQVLAQADS